jgi:hypothetical protein
LSARLAQFAGMLQQGIAAPEILISYLLSWLPQCVHNRTDTFAEAL